MIESSIRCGEIVKPDPEVEIRYRSIASHHRRDCCRWPFKAYSWARLEIKGFQ